MRPRSTSLGSGKGLVRLSRETTCITTSQTGSDTTHSADHVRAHDDNGQLNQVIRQARHLLGTSRSTPWHILAQSARRTRDYEVFVICEVATFINLPPHCLGQFDFTARARDVEWPSGEKKCSRAPVDRPSQLNQPRSRSNARRVDAVCLGSGRVEPVSELSHGVTIAFSIILLKRRVQNTSSALLRDQRDDHRLIHHTRLPCG